MENKAATYRKMLAFLGDLGADLGPHLTARIASEQVTTLDEMDNNDLMHYQRVLEATVDYRSDLMDTEALKGELTEVVRERFARGLVADKTAEAHAFRQRTASL